MAQLCRKGRALKVGGRVFIPATVKSVGDPTKAGFGGVEVETEHGNGEGHSKAYKQQLTLHPRQVYSEDAVEVDDSEPPEGWIEGEEERRRQASLPSSPSRAIRRGQAEDKPGDKA